MAFDAGKGNAATLNEAHGRSCATHDTPGNETKLALPPAQKLLVLYLYNMAIVPAHLPAPRRFVQRCQPSSPGDVHCGPALQ